MFKWMFGETTIFYVIIWNHPVETSIKLVVWGSRQKLKLFFPKGDLIWWVICVHLCRKSFASLISFLLRIYNHICYVRTYTYGGFLKCCYPTIAWGFPISKQHQFMRENLSPKLSGSQPGWCHGHVKIPGGEDHPNSFCSHKFLWEISVVF